MVLRVKASEEISMAVKENRTLKLSEKLRDTKHILSNSINLSNYKGNANSIDANHRIDNKHLMIIVLKNSGSCTNLFSKEKIIDAQNDNINTNSKHAVPRSDKVSSGAMIQAPNHVQPRLQIPQFSEAIAKSEVLNLFLIHRSTILSISNMQ